MLAVLTGSDYTGEIKAQLGGMKPSTPVILCGDGTYLYAELIGEFPALSIYVLAEDALARGVTLSAEYLIDYRDWVALSHKFYPWVLL
ncbi:hypothetical protein CA267_000260 [Alteromonas pelagimontana]|uniref:Sulfurtransferase complex subunit TusB n=1 Tax=Alteromonas pelagimontana TaxID=1858656 RepID=A0A6M4M992_9ALTE|nr:DsrH/TusB family sulfur metabolism protein [Alteromonas pelagimontana]QJR79338.1 hypothetical protein CA267_000260 [Alteromonas pelagimontana]